MHDLHERPANRWHSDGRLAGRRLWWRIPPHAVPGRRRIFAASDEAAASAKADAASHEAVPSAAAHEAYASASRQIIVNQSNHIQNPDHSEIQTTLIKMKTKLFIALLSFALTFLFSSCNIELGNGMAGGGYRGPGPGQRMPQGPPPGYGAGGGSARMVRERYVITAHGERMTEREAIARGARLRGSSGSCGPECGPSRSRALAARQSEYRRDEYYASSSQDRYAAGNRAYPNTRNTYEGSWAQGRNQQMRQHFSDRSGSPVPAQNGVSTLEVLTQQGWTPSYRGLH